MIKKIKQNWLIIILILFSLTPVIWFLGRGGVLINGSDTNFPLDPIIWFKRRFFVWNDVANAGTNFASSTAGFFFHLIQVIPFSLGASLQLTQIISLVFWFSLIIFASFVFAKAIVPQSKFAQLTFVTLYSFNIYLFNTWENVKVANLAVAVGLPLLLAIFASAREMSRARLIFLTALAGVIIAGAGINPAYFLVIIGGLVIFALVRGETKALLLMLSILVLVNSFWIVSTGKQLLFSQTKISRLSDIGFTNWLDSLSQNTSLLNVFRLQGAWDWYAKDDAGAALYIPYANNYFRRLPFVAFGIVLTSMALVSLVIKDVDKNRLKIYFGLLLILGLFLGAGSHPPTGALYEFLAKHLPFFSFFRSPWYIFTPYVILSLAGLTALLFSSGKRVFNLLAIVLIMGNLIYVYPLVTGKIFRPGRPDSFFVKFPDYVFNVGNWLKSQPANGRIIGYPGDEIERFNWGYNGIESILNLFSSQETVFSDLNNIDAPFAKLAQAYYTALRRGQVEISERLAAKLNISIIFEKNDQSTLWESIPQEVEKYDNTSFNNWTFYGLPDEKFQPKIFSPGQIFSSVPSDKISEMIGFAELHDLLVSNKDTVVKNLNGVNNFSGTIYLADNSQLSQYQEFTKLLSKQRASLTSKDLSEVVYSVDVSEAGFYQPVLENFMLDQFGVDWSNGLTVVIDGRQETWEVENSSDFLVLVPIDLVAGKHTIVIKLQNENLAPGSDRVLGITNRGFEEKYELIRIDPFVSFYPYLIEFDYRNAYGVEPVLRIEQKSLTTNFKFQQEAPPFSPEWTRFNFYFDPIPTSFSILDLKLLAAPTSNPLGTKLEYTNLAVYPVFTNGMVFIKEPEVNLAVPEKINFSKVNPVKYTGEVRGSDGSHIIVFSENYSPDWEIRLTNLGGTGITYDPPHFSANLYANAWFMEDLKGDYNFEIYYQPQRLHNVFLGVSVATLLTATGYWVWERIKK